MFKLKLMYLLAIFFSFINSQKNEYVGLRLAIKLSTIKDFQNYFFLEPVKENQILKLEDKEIIMDIGFSTAIIKLQDIKLNLLLKSQNFKISFIDPSSINIKIFDINIIGSFLINIKVGFLPEYETNIIFTSNRLDINTDLKLDERNHRNYKNKKTLYLEISKFDVDVEFNFSFASIVTELITSYFEEEIKSSVFDYLKSSLKSQLIRIINEEINRMFNEIPIFIQILDDSVMDYSLLEPPKILKDLLILNLKASFLQKSQIDNYIEDQDLNIGFKKLPTLTSIQKGIKIQISANSIKTLVKSLYLSNFLQYSYDIPNIVDIIPEKKGFMDFLAPQNILRFLGKIFGYDTKGKIALKILEIPNISIEENKLICDVKIGFLFLFENYLNSMIPLAIIESNVNFEVSGSVKENFEADFVIEKFAISSFKTSTKDFGLNLINNLIQFIINFELTKIVEVLNKAFIKNVKFDFPSVDGIDFNNSKIRIINNFVEVDVDVIFEKNIKDG